MRAAGWDLIDPGADLARPRRLSRLHPAVARRVHGGEGHLRATAQRLVQRPQRLLPRRRPAGRDAGHRLREVRAHGQRPVRVLHDGARRSTRSRASTPTTPRTAPARGAWPRRPSAPSRCCVGSSPTPGSPEPCASSSPAWSRPIPSAGSRGTTCSTCRASARSAATWSTSRTPGSGSTTRPRRRSPPTPAGGARYLAARARPAPARTMAPRWAVRAPDGTLLGLDEAALARACAGADLFLNLSGSCWLREPYRAARVDGVRRHGSRATARRSSPPRMPASRTRRRRAVGRAHPRARRLLHAGRARRAARLPESRRRASPGCPPASRSCSPTGRCRRAPTRRFTTVLSWSINPTPPVVGGRRYGGKDVEFERFLDLPQRTPERLEAAISGDGAARAASRRRAGTWSTRATVSASLDDYRRYLQRSRGELSVAKQAYVATRSGWFSTRSAAYLACGRPAVLQDTGFSAHLPIGPGLHAFTTAEEAVAALAAVRADYGRRAPRARSRRAVLPGRGRVRAAPRRRRGVSRGADRPRRLSRPQPARRLRLERGALPPRPARARPRRLVLRGHRALRPGVRPGGQRRSAPTTATACAPPATSSIAARARRALGVRRRRRAAASTARRPGGPRRCCARPIC